MSVTSIESSAAEDIETLGIPTQDVPDQTPTPYNALYPHPADNVFTSRILYREQCLRKFSALFRDHPHWTSKLDDPVYFNQKLREAQEYDKFLPRLNMSAAVWSGEDAEFVWRELVERYRPFVVKNRDSDGRGVEPAIDGVWKMNRLADQGVWGRLIEAVRHLEDVPIEEKFWRRFSQDQIWDLVHPSLWPIIYGRTTDSDGQAIQPPPVPDPPPFMPGLAQYHDPNILRHYSKKFCWLPSEFDISKDGKVKILSYINNLATEKQQELFYPILEKIFEGFVPLFNHVLAELREKKSEVRRVKWDDQYSTGVKKNEPEMKRFAVEETTESTVDWETFSKDFDLEPFIPPGGGPGDTILEIRDIRERLADMWTPPNPEVLEQVKLEGKKLKVIVKMMHVVVSPNVPFYTGGDWRVEGKKNERIVACGLYCYQQDNITEFGLSFRRGFESRQEGARAFFDIEKQDTCQDIGHVELGVNKGIAFPNIYHHREWACCLRDGTKRGYAKLIQFLLCDPSDEFTVETTRTVPAQQPEIRAERINAFRQACAGRLPMELIYEIEDHIPPSISAEESREYSEKVRTDGAEWTECIIQMGGDAGCYVRSKPQGETFERISSLNSYEWTLFLTRW
ncbi:hypothetical protein TWF481_003779 [Arthrobotrys musiformis]|uniref:DUF4246 domain-containing protein n=1 Tax=Arthrobotrys musiformis TaxID=47236 RepID=A0AAV9WHM7_9PEZI